MLRVKQFCTFELDGLLFGIEVEEVQEIIRGQAVTPVPLAPPEIEGLIDLRGQIVTAIDLRRRLELDDRRDDMEPMFMVLRQNGGSICLLVDRIGDIMDVGEELFERPPETVQGIARELIRGAYKLEDRLLLVLDVSATVDVGGDGQESNDPELMMF